ncbi:MAG: cysteine peptidase family C39 domain-containing protein, partial [Candidatus Omnitrophota bacterium]
MLNWQDKIWIKAIAIAVVIAFLTYDVAWASNFSPVSLSPRRKEEQSGFNNLEATKQAIDNQQREVKRLRDIQEAQNRQQYINFKLTQDLFNLATEKAQKAQDIQQLLMKSRGEVQKAIASVSEFSYTLQKDGTKIYFTDGLPTTILNEPVVDSFGGRSIRNTYNMKYYGDRLLESSDSETIDSFGNATKTYRYGITWSPDSQYYATEDTNAVKLMLSYKEIIENSYGVMNQREWETSRENYEGSRVKEYTETMKDAIGNIISTSTWKGKEWEGDNVKSYEQSTESSFGTSNTEWEAEFDSNGHMTKAITKQVDNSKDGSISESLNTTFYTYDASGKLISSVGKGTSKGEDEVGNLNEGTSEQVYEIVDGKQVLKKSISDYYAYNIDGSTSHSVSTVEYTYNERYLITGGIGKTIVTGEDIFNNSYTTESTDYYEEIAGQAKRIKSIALTNSTDLSGSENNSESYTYYEYDDTTGELISAEGYTYQDSEDVFGNRSITRTDNYYQIINGQAKLVGSFTAGDMVNPTGTLGNIVASVEKFLTDYVDASYEAKKAMLKKEGIGIEAGLFDLTSVGVSKILDWLKRSSTNVINCAINAINNIFSKLGITIKEEELIVKPLLIDILTGALKPEDSYGDLSLSMYSIMKLAESKGVTLSGIHLNSIEQLQEINEEVIAHVRTKAGGHFITIKEVTTDFVLYVEAGEEKTMSVVDFLGIWEGNVLSRVMPEGGVKIEEGALKTIKGSDVRSIALYSSNAKDNKPSSKDLPKEVPDSVKAPNISGYDEKSDMWSNASFWEWDYIDNESRWQAVYRERYVKKYESNGKEIKETYDNLGNKLDYTETWKEGDNRFSRTYKVEGGKDILTGGFTKEDVTEDGLTYYRHVRQWSEDGGFEIYRSGSPRIGAVRNKDYYVWYKTWNNKDDSMSLTEVNGLNVYMKSQSEDVTSIISAELYNQGDGRGVQWADYWVKNTENDSITLARIEREGNTYNIDGRITAYEGILTAVMSLNRVIGGDIKERSLYVLRNDLMGIEWPEVNYKPEGEGYSINESYYKYGEDEYTGLGVKLGIPEKLTVNVNGIGNFVIDLSKNWAFPKKEGDQLIIKFLEEEVTRGTLGETTINIWCYDTSKKYKKGETIPLVQKSITFTVYYNYKIRYNKATGQTELIVSLTKKRVKGQTYTETEDEDGTIWIQYNEPDLEDYQEDIIKNDNPYKVNYNKTLEGKSLNTLKLFDKWYKDTKKDWIEKQKENWAKQDSNEPEPNWDKKWEEQDKDSMFSDLLTKRYFEVNFTQYLTLKYDAASGGYIPVITRKYANDLLTQVFTGFSLHKITDTELINATDDKSIPVSTSLYYMPGTLNSLATSIRTSKVMDYTINISTSPDAETGVSLEGDEIVKEKTQPIAPSEGMGASRSSYLDLRNVLQGQTVMTFTGEALSTLVLPVDRGGVVRYKAKETISQGIFRMEDEFGDANDILVDMSEKGKITIKYTDSAEGAISMNISGIAITAESRGVTVQGRYEESQDIYGNKIALFDLGKEDEISKKTLKESKTIVTSIKEFLEEQLSKQGDLSDKFRKALKDIGGLKKLIEWLSAMGTYVINCAVESTRTILSRLGQDVGREEIAVDMILLDLLSGNLSTKTTPILYSSFSSLERISSARGISLETMYLTSSQLNNMTSPFIAQVDLDHAIVVLGVDGDNVYIVDGGKKYTISKIDFLKRWSGFVLAERAPIIGDRTVDVDITNVASPLAVYTALSVEKDLAPISSRPEDLTKEAIRARIEEELLVTPTSGSTILFSRSAYGDMITRRTYRRNEGDFETITNIGIDGSLSYSESWVDYDYDINGRLISAVGGGTSWAENLFGGFSVSNTTNIYEVIFNQAKVASSQTTTTSTNPDGSKSTTISNVTYTYTDGTEDPGAFPGRIDKETGRVYKGVLKNATGTNETTGTDIFNNTYKSISNDTYKVINGEAKVAESKTTTTSESISGNLNTSVSTLRYIYTDGSESPSGLSKDYIDKDGRVIKGLLLDAEGNTESSSEDVFGNINKVVETTDYIVLYGRAKPLKSTSISESLSISGNLSKSQSITEYIYSTEEAPYIDPYTGRTGIGALIDAKGSSTQSVEDIFGTITITKSTNRYEIIDGNAKVVEARSVSESQSAIDGSLRKDESITTYSYTKGAEGLGSLDPQYISGDGSVYRGLLLDVSSESTSTAEDMFGTVRVSKTKNTFIYKNGESFVVRSDTVTDVEKDLFGNSSTTTSWVEYDYGAIRIGEQGALRDAAWVVNDTRGGSYGEGSDIYGSSYSFTTINTYTIKQGQSYVMGTRTTREGSDAFGSSYTVNEWADYEFNSLKKGQLGALRDANWIMISAKGGNENNSTDIYGSDSNSKTATTYTYYKGQVYVDRTDTITTGTDAFGSKYTTTAYTKNSYGILRRGVNGALRDAEFVVIDVVGGSESESKTIFGEDSYSKTINTYILLKGQSLVASVKTQTKTSDVFGSSSTSDSVMTYSYYKDGSGPNKVYGEIESADSAATNSSKDIWGNDSTSTTATEYVIINNRPLASKVATDTESIDFFGGRSTSQSVMTYDYYADESGPNKVYGEISSAGSTATSESTDIWGNDSTSSTTTDFVIINNRALASKVITVTDSTDLFGGNSKTDSVMTYEYYADESGPNKVYGEIESAGSTATSESTDIWGNNSSSSTY